MNQSSLFKNVGLLEVRKYLPLLFYRNYHHGEVLYSQGEKQKALEVVVEGEVDIKKKIGEETVKVVKLGPK